MDLFVRRDDDGRFGRLLFLRSVLQSFCLTRPPWNSRRRRALLDSDRLGNFPPFGEPATEPASPEHPAASEAKSKSPQVARPGRAHEILASAIDRCPSRMCWVTANHRIRTTILRHTKMSAANVSACLHAKSTFMCSGPPSKARLMPSQKLALAFSQSIRLQRLRRNTAVRLLETEGRDSAAYASNSAVSYHILSPTIQARSTIAAAHGRSRMHLVEWLSGSARRRGSSLRSRAQPGARSRRRGRLRTASESVSAQLRCSTPRKSSGRIYGGIVRTAPARRAGSASIASRSAIANSASAKAEHAQLALHT